MRYIIELPWPHRATANHLWRKTRRGQIYISSEALAFRAAVQDICASASVRQMQGPVKLRVDVYPPDNRRRDIDNIIKPLLDALTSAGAWQDDVQVSDLHVVRMPKKSQGCLAVTWCELNGRDDVD